MALEHNRYIALEHQDEDPHAPNKLGQGAVTASDINVYRIPKPQLVLGCIVKVRYFDVPEEKATLEVMISDDKQSELPPGVRVVHPRTPLAHALLEHNLDDGASVSFETVTTSHQHRQMTVEIIEIDGRPVS